LKQTKEIIDPLLFFEQRNKASVIKTEISKNGQSVSWEKSK
jgi:hypothetical protein